jgi:hypothetical protein
VLQILRCIQKIVCVCRIETQNVCGRLPLKVGHSGGPGVLCGGSIARDGRVGHFRSKPLQLPELKRDVPASKRVLALRTTEGLLTAIFISVNRRSRVAIAALSRTNTPMALQMLEPGKSSLTLRTLKSLLFLPRQYLDLAVASASLHVIQLIDER